MKETTKEWIILNTLKNEKKWKWNKSKPILKAIVMKKKLKLQIDVNIWKVGYSH